MVPVKIELPVSTPRDLHDDFVGLLRQLGPVLEPQSQSFTMDTVMLVLAAVSATADLLAIAQLLIAWREEARQRGVRLDKVTIVAGDQRIKLQNTDARTLMKLLEELRKT